MTEFVQIVTTVETAADAERIATALLEQRLAACVQIVGPIASHYWWQGKIEQASEYQCLIKSRHELFAAVEAAIVAIHPYQTPEILATPVVAGGAGYLAWLNTELRPEQP
ncbi:MAG TPA: divalent-cation tolerance protein CutA [Desulfurivibrionaceae bacterium]|nr:divalent-cation tolerance protein CutA [Desulfurivibrionaceae bacterium]